MLVKDLVEDLLFYGEDYDVELEVNGENLSFSVFGNDSLKSVILDVEEKSVAILDTVEHEELLEREMYLEQKISELEDEIHSQAMEIRDLQGKRE